MRLLLAELDLAALHGGIICAPVANVAAYENFHRVGPIDHLDLNRVFPGKSNGSLTERVAAVLVREVVAQSTALLDLHSAGFAYDLYPYVGFNATPGCDRGGLPRVGEGVCGACPLRVDALSQRPAPGSGEARDSGDPGRVGGEARCDPAGVAAHEAGTVQRLASAGDDRGTAGRDPGHLHGRQGATRVASSPMSRRGVSSATRARWATSSRRVSFSGRSSTCTGSPWRRSPSMSPVWS